MGKVIKMSDYLKDTTMKPGGWVCMSCLKDYVEIPHRDTCTNCGETGLVASWIMEIQ